MRGTQRTLTAVVAFAAAGILLSAGNASAQTDGGPSGPGEVSAARFAAADSHATVTAEMRAGIRQSIVRQSERAEVFLLQPSRAVQTPKARPPRSVWQKLAGGAVGAVGGFYGGAFLGAAIEGNRCACDDPGLLGALIGAPIGAVAGGIAGAMFLF